MALKKQCGKRSKNKTTNSRKIFRCTLLPLLKFIKKIKSKIREAHLEEMKKTTFWHLFTIFYEEMVEEDSLKLTTSGILSILETFAIRELGFNIGAKTLMLKPEDFCITFGLKMKGVEVQPFNGRKDKFSKKSNFCQGYFGNSTKILRSTIESCIERIVEIEGKEEDFAKLIILHMACSIFFTNGAGNEIQTNFLQHIEDYESINSISWPRTIHGYLMQKVIKNREKPITISGCVLQLLYWICEHAHIIDPIEGSEGRFPRAARWNLKHIAKAIPEKLKILQVNEISENFLVEPTLEERDLLNESQEEEEIVKTEEEDAGLLNENKMLKEDNIRLQELLNKALKETDEMENEYIERVNEHIEVNVRLIEVEEENKKNLEELQRTRRLLKEVEEEKDRINEEMDGLKAAMETMPSIYSEEEKEDNNKNVDIKEEEEQQEEKEEEKKREENKEEEANKERSWIRRIKEKKFDNDFVVEPLRKKQKKEQKEEKKREEEKKVQLKEKGKGKAVKSAKKVAKKGEEPKQENLGDVTKGDVWKHTKERQKATIKEFFDNADKRIVVWRGRDGGIFITFEMLVDLMFNRFIDSQVIDWYIENLKHSKFNCGSSLCFSSMTWTYMQDKKYEDHVKKTVDDVIINFEGAFEVLVFPMNTTKRKNCKTNYHWTLLAYDERAFPMWKHYNSIMPKGKKDRYLEQAKELQQRVIPIINRRRVHRGLDPLINDDEVSSVDCSQQIAIADCAMHVCMHVKRIVCPNIFKSTQLPEDMEPKTQRKRASIMYKIITNEACNWQPKTDSRLVAEK